MLVMWTMCESFNLLRSDRSGRGVCICLTRDECDWIYISKYLQQKRKHTNFNWLYLQPTQKNRILSADLDSCDWNSLYCTAEANTQLEILQRKVKILYDRTVPLKRKMCKHRAKSWFNYVIKNIIQKHDKSYAKRKRYKTQNFYNDFKSNRKLVNENWSLQSRNEITTYINSDIQKTIKIHGQF